MAGRPKHRARVAAALAKGEPPPPNPRSSSPAQSAEHAAERVRLQKLLCPPSGFTVNRCKAKLKSGKRRGEDCGAPTVWGLDVCVKHGGLAPERQAELRKRIGMLLDFLDPRKLLIKAHQIIDAHLGMITEAPGKFLPVSKWPDEIWPTIRSIKILNFNTDGSDGKTECVVDVQLVPQERYHEMLMKNAGQLMDKLQVGKHQHEQVIDREFVEALEAGLARAAESPPPDNPCPHCHGTGIEPRPQLAEAKPDETINVTPEREREPPLGTHPTGRGGALDLWPGAQPVPGYPSR